ncbi:MAG: paraquat-inducible protein A [Desulfocapsa sp.]|nr:paraquat-inducible protein A [Desulfocapsa sp.]
MNSPITNIACPGCDLLLKIAEAPPGKKLFCPRCNTQLYQKKVNSITKILAISLSGLLVYIPAIFMPLLTLNTMGIHQYGSIFDAFLTFHHQKYYFVAVLVLLTSILLPLLRLSFLFSVALQLRLRMYSRSLPFLFRTSHLFDEWGMPDVYLIALFVSIIKIESVASIEYNFGFFCFLFLVLMTRAAVSALDPEAFWNEIEKIKAEAYGAAGPDNG